MRSNYSREECQKIVIELLNCWVHARRGFADAVKATKSKHAAQAIKLFKDVFDNENRLRKLFDEEKKISPGILKLRLIKFVENGFNVYYN